MAEPTDTIMHHLNNILNCESGKDNAEEAHRHFLRSADIGKANLWRNKATVWQKEKDDSIAEFLRYIEENFTYTPQGEKD